MQRGARCLRRRVRRGGGGDNDEERSARWKDGNGLMYECPQRSCVYIGLKPDTVSR